jgi:hypothetical protein
MVAVFGGVKKSVGVIKCKIKILYPQVRKPISIFAATL